MIYAPIVIPTLNRIEHLRRCINSLKRNRYAKYTDLYVSVDFPPEHLKWKYMDGYDQVKLFCNTIEGFNHVFVFFQEINLGPSSNATFLLNQILKDGYDCYIFSEDDNEFSPNFIEYMDKGLEKYRNNSSVHAICATSPFYLDRSKVRGNYFIKNDFSPYGSAFWISKDTKLAQTMNEDYLKSLLKNRAKRWRLFLNRPKTYQMFSLDLLREYPAMRSTEGELLHIDGVIAMYCVLENKYCVFPMRSKVRNWGRDGSGVNCANEENYVAEEDIDDSPEFSFVTDPNLRSLCNSNIKISIEKNRIPLKSLIRAWLVVTGKRTLNEKLFWHFISLLKMVGKHL